MSKIADTLRVLAVALPGFVLLPQAAADGVQKTQFLLQSLAFLLQLLQGGLTAFELFFQSRLNALRLLGFLINALGIDKTDFLHAIRQSCSRKARLWSKN
jgi:hypothetical protein